MPEENGPRPEAAKVRLLDAVLGFFLSYVLLFPFAALGHDLLDSMGFDVVFSIVASALSSTLIVAALKTRGVGWSFFSKMMVANLIFSSAGCGLTYAGLARAFRGM